MRLRPQLCPGPRWGAHDAPLDSLAGWEGGTPFPHPTPLGAELEPRAFSSRPVVESKKSLNYTMINTQSPANDVSSLHRVKPCT